MKKEFVIYPLALRLKALGFDEPCVKYVYIGNTGTNCNVDGEVLPSKAENFNADSLSISIPTYSQAFRWFREKHKLVSYIDSYLDDDNEAYVWYILDYNQKPYLMLNSDENFSSYEEAELECLNKLITILEDKQ